MNNEELSTTLGWYIRSKNGFWCNGYHYTGLCFLDDESVMFTNNCRPKANHPETGVTYKYSSIVELKSVYNEEKCKVEKHIIIKEQTKEDADRILYLKEIIRNEIRKDLEDESADWDLIDKCQDEINNLKL